MNNTGLVVSPRSIRSQDIERKKPRQRAAENLYTESSVCVARADFNHLSGAAA